MTACGGAEPSDAPRPPVVLVVDDDETNRKVAGLMLTRLGYLPALAGGGREGVDAARRTSCAAVLMDCLMPGMDGYEATAEIRRREASGRHVPIIAMTAAVLPGDEARALEAGMDDFISKPVALPELRAALGRWVAGADLLPSTAPAPGGGSPPAPVGSGGPVPVLDAGRLAHLRGFESDGAGGVLHVLVDLFLETADSRIGEVRRAAAAGDLAETARLAHGLRGSCANVAAARMAVCAERLEDAARANDPSGVAQAIRDLAAAFEPVGPALREEFPGST